MELRPKPPIAPPRGRGFVLVLVVGVLGLLVLLGIAAVRVAQQAQHGSQAGLGSVRARLAAESGMEYAAGRLRQDGAPRFLDDAASRGDDWTCREPLHAPLSRAGNPSYSHGEPWLNRPFVADGADNDADGIVDEAGEGGGVFESGDSWTDANADGICDPGEWQDLNGNGLYDSPEAFVDRDGDGRFTPFSGRLRGGVQGVAARFLLRVRGSDGGIPLNAGALWADDLHGTSPDDLGNGTPDHCDLQIFYHAGLAHVLNNLGAVLAGRSPPRLWTRCEEVPTGAASNPGEPRRISWLGDDLLSRRPAGGYRSMDEVRDALLSLDYELREIEGVLPYLELGPYDCPPGTGRYFVKTQAPYYPYAPIGLSTAPSEVLEACWRYLWTNAQPGTIPGEPPGWDEECSRTGQPGLSGTLPYRSLSLVIYPDEAEALARETIRFRQQGGATWKGYFEWLSANAPGIFAQDSQELSNAGYPENAEGWAQAKMELAFWAACMDPPLGLGAHGAATWATWGIDRDRDPANGVQPNAIVSFYYVLGAKMPGVFQDPAPWPSPASPFNSYGRLLRTQGLTIAAPISYRIGSWGTQGGCEGEREGVLQLGERLELTSQEDFENHHPDSPLRARGIGVHDPAPQYRREIAADDMGTSQTDDDRIYPRVASLPRFSKRAVAPLPAATLPPYWGYSRCYGALTLAAREGGRRKADRYWAFSEDFDQMENSLSVPGPSLLGLKPNLAFWPEPTLAGDLPALLDVQVPYANPDTNATGALKTGLCAIGGGGPIQWPGLDGPAGSLVQRLAIECWMSPSGSKWDLRGSGGYIQLFCGREPSVTGMTRFDLSVQWPSNGTSSQPVVALHSFFADDEGLRRVAWDYHVALLVECDPVANTTTFRLFVNGSDEVPGAPGLKNETPPLPRVMKVTDQEMFSGYGIDELRAYGASLSVSALEDELQKCWEVERYVRAGGFTSPTYVFEEALRLPDKAGWLGFVPPAFFQADPLDPNPPVRAAPAHDSSGREVQLLPLIVQMDGYVTRPGDPGHPTLAPGFPKVLPYDQVADLRGCGRIRSFRYRVFFDAGELAGVLDDTPVFESIWFTFRGAGRPSAWRGWSAR